ncbi:MAG: four helix bundle protein [Deltaproteobacteria bacterium]|nr:four helix bundle protein [Deltaproteobacteria bacterium]
MKYKFFEELPCWLAARDVCKSIYLLIQQNRFKHDFSLRDQMWRASGSIMDNIAEGFDDGSTREFVRFLGYSQRSCGEVQSQLCRAYDCNYITQEQFDKTYNSLSECRKQVKGFRKYLREYAARNS